MLSSSICSYYEHFRDICETKQIARVKLVSHIYRHDIMIIDIMIPMKLSHQIVKPTYKFLKLVSFS